MKDQKIADAALSLGVTRQRVQTLCDQGKLDFYKKKNRVWITGGSLQRRINEISETKTIEKSGKANEPDKITGITTGQSTSLAKVELALKAEKYKTQKIRNERDEKKLISVDELTDRVFNFIRKLRDHQQNLPDALADKFLAAESRHEIEQLCRDYETRGLNQIAENFNNLDEDGLKKKIIQLLTM